MTIDKPVICPVLVGREPQLSAIEDALASAAAGKGQTVLIAGDAGVGKSRLVAEARAKAAERDVLVLQGNCFEPDQSLPYGPMIDLLRAYFTMNRSPQDVSHQIGPAGPEILKLLPEFAARLPRGAPSAALEPEAEKRRLFHALILFFTGLAMDRPLVIVIEDAHWSDETSLEFLGHLARAATSKRLLLLVCYRREEAHAGLMRLLAALDRDRLAIELHLRPLSRSEVDAMVRATFGLRRPLRPEDLQDLYEMTDGYPFFVEEILRSLVYAGAMPSDGGMWERTLLNDLRIPRTIQETVRHRVEQLSPAAREVVTCAAVAGRRFDFALLQAITQRDEPDLLRIMKELIAAQLVVEGSNDQFAFRHALTRQAISAELLARERKALHKAIAEAIERLHAGAALEACLEDLVYHYTEAGAWGQVFEYAPRAGERAQALYAPSAAAKQFSRALTAAERLDIEPPPRLFRARGLAYETVGEFERAQRDLEAAHTLARAGGDRFGEWQGMIDLGMLWDSRDYARSGLYFQRALDFARAMGEPSALAHSLNRLGNWHLNIERPSQARSYHREALAIFQAIADRRGMADTYDLLGMTGSIGADLIDGHRWYEQAVALFRELDDRRGLVSSLATLLHMSGCFGNDSAVSSEMDFASACTQGEAALQLARDIAWRAGEAYAQYSLAIALGPRGEYARALACAHAALQTAAEIEHREWVVAAHWALGALHLDLLALAPARQHLDLALALARDTGSPFWISWTGGMLASVAVQDRDFAQAEAMLGAVLSHDTPVETIAQRACWCVAAELALAQGHALQALEMVNRLIASAAHVSDDRPIPRLWQLRGEALAALGRPADGEVALRAAADGAAAQGLKPRLWRAQVALAQVYRQQERRGEAEVAFAAARGTIEDLAASIPDAPLHEAFLPAATALLPRTRPLSAREAEKQAYGGLTARERQVASLIAHGKSNPAIAAELVLSRRTVEAYVEAILDKLGFASRTQIAVWAVDKGLARGAE